MHQTYILFFLIFFSVSLTQCTRIKLFGYGQLCIKFKAQMCKVFKTLQRSLSEFINQTEWTDESVKPAERIDCAL